MKICLLVVVLTTWLLLCSAFDCNSTIDMSSCSQLEGCNWNQDVCIGTFSPPCFQSNCYYVDPVEGSDLQDGSPQSPFKTLTQGFQILNSKNGSLIVINYNSQPETEITNYINIDSSIIIKPLFNESSFVISLTNFDALDASGRDNAITISAGVFQIIGATVNSATTKSLLKKIFQVNNAQLFFYNVSIFEDVGDFYLVNIDAGFASSKFSYIGGKYSESSFLFNLLAGTHLLEKLEFNRIKASDVLFNVSESILVIDGVNVKEGNTLFLSISGRSTNFTEPLFKNSLTARNINMSEYGGNFLAAYDISMSLSQINFVDLDLVDTAPFISARGPLYFSVILQGILFQNITVKNTLMFISNHMPVKNRFPWILFSRVEATNITMDTIKKSAHSSFQTNKDLEFQSIWTGGVCFFSQNNVKLWIEKSKFFNISTHCLGLEDSLVVLENSIFNNSALSTETTYQWTLNASDNSNGVSWILFHGGSLEKSSITNCQFIENKIAPNFGGVIRFTGFSPAFLSSTRNIMINNCALYGGAFYSNNPFLEMVSAWDTFWNNTADYGGAIYKTSQINSKYNLSQSTTLAISGGNFFENKALFKGGSLFLRQEKFNIVDCSFYRNQALFGGAIYAAETEIFSSENFGIKETNFDSNFAQGFGSAMILFIPLDIAETSVNSSLLTLTNNIDAKNQTIFARKISHFRFSFYQIQSEEDQIDLNDENLHRWITNSSKRSLNSSFNTSEDSPPDFILRHKSGNALNQSIAIEIFDETEQLADFVNDDGIIIDLIATQNNVSTLQAFLYTAPIRISFHHGTIYLKNRLIIYGHPRTTATLRFQGFNTDLGFLSDQNFVLSQTIQVYFEDCELGDTYNPTTTICNPCPQGSYSLSDPYKTLFCFPCNNQLAFCPGGYKIVPKPGFWRYNITSDKILECPIRKACAGGFGNVSYVLQGECEFPYEGNLCNRCATGYAKDSSLKRCVNCQGNIFYYAKTVVFFILQLMMAFLALRSYILPLETQFDKYEVFNSCLLRIAFSYLQICGIISQLNISWPDWVFDIIAYLNDLSPGGQGGFSPNCILKLVRDNDEDVYFIQLIITLIKPFFAWISMVSMYLLYLVWTRKFSQSYQEFKRNMKILFLILAYMCQPSIIKATLILFRCKNLSSEESPVYFMLDQTEVECWTKHHILWSVVIGLPNLVLWTAVFPFLLFRTISKKVNRKTNSSRKDLEYAFIYTGLKRERFYWELVTMLRKVLFIIILVFFSMLSDKTQVFALFGLLYIFVYIQYKFRPFEDRRLNFLEMFSILCLTIVTYSGISILLEGVAWLNDVFVFSALALNLVFCLTLAFYFVKNYKEIAKKNIQNLIQSDKNKQNDLKDAADPKSPQSDICVNCFKPSKLIFNQPKEHGAAGPEKTADEERSLVRQRNRRKSI